MTSKPSNPSVTQLTRYLTEAELRDAMQFVHTREVHAEQQDVRVPGRIKTTDTLSEDVSELNGLAVPAFFEAQTTGQMSAMQVQCLEQLSSGHAYRAEVARELGDMNDFLRLAAIYGFVTGGFLAKPEQIKQYGWLPPAVCEPLLAVLRQHLAGLPVDYEVSLDNLHAHGRVEVCGRADAMTSEHIYELKCVRELTDEHKLQLVLYGWLWDEMPDAEKNKLRSVGTTGPRALRLLNFRTGELLEMTSTAAERAHVARVLIEAYLRGEPKLDDTVFLQKCVKNRTPFLRPAG